MDFGTKNRPKFTKVTRRQEELPGDVRGKDERSEIAGSCGEDLREPAEELQGRRRISGPGKGSEEDLRELRKRWPGGGLTERVNGVARAVSSYKKLITFGRIFEVDQDEDYKAAAMTYAEEAKLIAEMRTQLKNDGMTVNKEYVKGRQNVCVHPLVTEIPKHVDCANRTLGILGDIIVKRGRKKPEEMDALDEFRL